MLEDQKVIFLRCVKNRLVGDAYYLKSLEKSLKNAYMPKLSLEDLRDELWVCRQRPGENLM